jgi:diguanylate cyclase (GGDEF)-like protein
LRTVSRSFSNRSFATQIALVFGALTIALAMAAACALLRETTLAALLIGVLAVAIASLLALRAARHLGREMHLIARAARQVEEGAPGAAMPAFGGSREVAQLSSALGSMTRQLLASHQRMEEELHERTRELAEANAELDRQARSDPLTGLFNRRGFGERMQLAMASAQRSGRPLAVAMLDADHFKRVNDTFGHDVGDLVLRFLARTLQGRVRASDTAARLGGEEFVALLPDTGVEGALVMAEGLREAIAAHLDPVYGRITVSIGVAAMVGEEGDGPLLLHRADEALYRAKREGRNRVCTAEPEDAAAAAAPA